MRNAFLFVLLAGRASAAGPLPVSLMDIGVAAAVRGAVTARAPGLEAKAVGREVASGKPLYLNDKIKTGKDARLQIMLLDETTFTIGQDSEMLLDEFVYDPATNKGKVSAQIVKGAFRFVTGKIARRDVGDMKVGLPVGTIGIRGTIVEGVVHESGDADVALGGPGQDNNAEENPGGITVSNEAGSVDIDHGGYMTSIKAGAAPTAPIRVTPEFKAQSGINVAEADLKDAVGDSGAEGAGEGAPNVQASASETSGDSAAQANAHAGMLFEDVASGEPEQTQFAAQEVTSNAATPAGIIDGVSRWENVQQLTSGGRGAGQAGYNGSGSYSCSGGECSSGATGTFQFQMAVNFTNKTVGGNFSYVNMNSGPLSAYASVGQVSYSEMTSGSANLSLLSGISENPGFTGLTLSFLNKSGVVADQGRVSFDYSSQGGETASGSGTANLGTIQIAQ